MRNQLTEVLNGARDLFLLEALLYVQYDDDVRGQAAWLSKTELLSDTVFLIARDTLRCLAAFSKVCRFTSRGEKQLVSLHPGPDTPGLALPRFHKLLGHPQPMQLLDGVEPMERNSSTETLTLKAPSSVLDRTSSSSARLMCSSVPNRMSRHH